MNQNISLTNIFKAHVEIFCMLLCSHKVAVKATLRYCSCLDVGVRIFTLLQPKAVCMQRVCIYRSFSFSPLQNCCHFAPIVNHFSSPDFAQHSSNHSVLDIVDHKECMSLLL